VGFTAGAVVAGGGGAGAAVGAAGAGAQAAAMSPMPPNVNVCMNTRRLDSALIAAPEGLSGRGNQKMGRSEVTWLDWSLDQVADAARQGQDLVGAGVVGRSTVVRIPGDWWLAVVDVER